MRKLLLVLLLLSLPQLHAQQAAPAETKIERKTSNPYTGDLGIFENAGREDALQIDRVMDILAIAPGKNVADIGAGSGWFSVRAAKRVADGTVFAVDINPEAIRYIDARTKKENISNVKTVLGKPDDPRLPQKVDAVLLLKTYHEIAEPIALLRNLKSSLAPEAKLGVIDRNGNGTDHGISKDVIIREAGEAGYRLLEQYDFVKDGMDYFLVFVAKP